MTITRLSAGQYCSVREYAAMNGVSRVMIYKALERKRLDGRKIDGIWVIPVNAVIRDCRIKHGRMIGIRALMRGDMEAFEKARGKINKPIE